MLSVYPNILDSLVGTTLCVAMLAFSISAFICRYRIDAWALDSQRRRGEEKRYFQLIPPVDVMIKEWRTIGRIRDVAGYALCGCLVYFIGRGIWLAVL